MKINRFHFAFAAALAALTLAQPPAHAGGGGVAVGGSIQVPTTRRPPVVSRWSCSDGSHYCSGQQRSNGWIVRDKRANPGPWSPDRHATRNK